MIDHFKIGISFIVMLFSFPLIGQQYISVHQADYEKYKNLPKHESLFDPEGKDILPFSFADNTTPTSAVFGYLPYWKYPQALPYLQYDLLSHIAVFNFPVSENGDISYPSYWPWTDLINSAHEENVKVIMTGVNFSSSEIHNILTNPTVQNNFFSQAGQIILDYNLQGINVDFENIYTSDRGSVLNNFMADLTDYLKNAVPGSEVSFASPPVNWGGWDYEGLAGSCDYLFIMGYNFYGPWSETSGACAPLTGGSYNITNVVEIEYATVTENNPEKLILGIPYYGNHWETEDSASYSPVINHINQLTYESAVSIVNDNELLWDEYSQTSWYAYQLEESWQQLWFDNDTSLGLKYDLAESYNYKGVGMWALGYDGSLPELWDELRRRYGEPIQINEYSADKFIDLKCITSMGKIDIIYHLPAKALVSLSVVNVSGQTLWTDHQFKPGSGEYRHAISIQGFPSGIYFIRIVAQSENKKVHGVQKVILR